MELDALPCSVAEAARAFGFTPDAVTADELHRSVTGASLGTWRVHAFDGDVERDHCIVKIVVPHHATASPMWQASTSPSDPWYWRREVALLSSGLLDTLPDSRIRPPHVRAVCERDDGSIALFLEDVSGYAGSRWSFARYRVAARHLGRLHGAYLAGAAAPRAGILSHHWLAAYLERRHDLVGTLRPRGNLSEEHRRLVPDAVLHAAQRVWDERATLLGYLERMPQVLCHLDLHPANLFALRDDDGVERTVLIDWQFAGIGALGEDIGNLALDAVLDFHVAGADAELLRDVLLDGYVNGLRALAPDVDERRVRFAICTAATLKYWWVPIHLANLLSDDAVPDADRILNGRLLAAAAPSWSAALREWFAMYRVVRELEREFGVPQ